VAFGPRNNRNFTLSMNKKERRLALFSVLTSKLNDKNLVIVDGVSMDSPRTKQADTFYKALPYQKNILFGIAQSNEAIEKSSANLPYVKTILVNYLNIKDLLKYKTLVLEKASLEHLELLVK
jgi:large subunit ribosomal protein L4